MRYSEESILNSELFKVLTSETVRELRRFQIPMEMEQDVNRILTDFGYIETGRLMDQYPDQIPGRVITQRAFDMANAIIRELENSQRSYNNIYNDPYSRQPGGRAVYRQESQYGYNGGRSSSGGRSVRRQSSVGTSIFNYDQPDGQPSGGRSVERHPQVVRQEPTREEQSYQQSKPISRKLKDIRGGRNMTGIDNLLTLSEMSAGTATDKGLFKKMYVVDSLTKYKADDKTIKATVLMSNSVHPDEKRFVESYLEHQIDHKCDYFVDKVEFFSDVIIDIPTEEFDKFSAFLIAETSDDNNTIDNLTDKILGYDPKVLNALESILVDKINFNLTSTAYVAGDPSQCIQIEHLSDIRDLLSENIEDMVSPGTNVEFAMWSVWNTLLDMTVPYVRIVDPKELTECIAATINLSTGIMSLPSFRGMVNFQLTDAGKEEFKEFMRFHTLLRLPKRVIITNMYSDNEAYIASLRSKSTVEIEKGRSTDKDRWTSKEALENIMADISNDQAVKVVIVDPKTKAIKYEGLIGNVTDEVMGLINKTL